MDKDIILEVVNVLTNSVENDPVYPFSVEYEFSVETLIVHAVNVLSSIVENVPLFPFNAVMVMGVLTTIVENTALLPFNEDTFAVEHSNVLTVMVEKKPLFVEKSFVEIIPVER